MIRPEALVALVRLKLGVPSKGRLQEETIAWFAARGITLARSGGEREYRGTVARRRGRRARCCSRRPRSRASWPPGGCISASPGRTWCARRSRAGRSGVDRAGADGLRLRRPRGGGAGVLDRRRRHVRPRRRGGRVPRPPRPPAAGGDQVPPPGARVLPGARRRRLPARRQPGRDRGDGEEPDRRGGRRHHHHRLDAARQPPARARRRPDPAEPGDALRRPRRAPDPETAAALAALTLRLGLPEPAPAR